MGDGFLEVPKPPKLTFQDDTALMGPNRNALLDLVKKQGGKLIQLDTIYGKLHNAQGYNFQPYDDLVNAARERGLGVRMRLMGTPKYLKEGDPSVDDSLGATKANPKLMEQYAKDMATHFNHRVGGYSAWNEPNVGSFIYQDTPQAAKTYRKLYDATWKGVKGVNKNAKVSFGELTSQRPETTGPLSTLGFLRNVIAAGKKPIHADALSIHPYQWSDPNKKVGGSEFGGISNLGAIQKELGSLQKSGRLTTGSGGRVPLSISEYGYKHDVQGNAAVRAKWLTDSYKLAKQAGAIDFNMYQLMPSIAGRYWDSSILNAQGGLPPEMRVAFQRMRGLK